MKQDIQTTDIVLAATLKVMNQKLSHIEKNGNRGIFFFSEVDEKIIKDFNLGNSLVEPIAFNNAIKALTSAARRIS